MFIAVILLVIFIFGVIYIKYENKALSVTVYNICKKNLPKEFDKMRFVCLTDLHNNKFGSNNKKLIKKIDNYCPDYILIAGDMIVSGDNSKQDISIKLIMELSKRYKIVYAFGNHESRSALYNGIEFYGYIEKLKAAGIIILRNSFLEIERQDKKLRIYGIELPLEVYKKHKLINKHDIDLMLGKTDKNMYNILLAHHPNYFHIYSDWGADLVFSGHIHGGVMILPHFGGVISPLYEIFPKYDYGRFDDNESIMLLSRGLGTHTIPVRIFNKPELICVELIV